MTPGKFKITDMKCQPSCANVRDLTAAHSLSSQTASHASHSLGAPTCLTKASQRRRESDEGGSPDSHTSHASHNSPHEAPAPPDEWITTTLAGALTNFSRRWINALCDKGFFVEGKEWKQRPPCPGFRKGGMIWIQRSALKKLERQSRT